MSLSPRLIAIQGIEFTPIQKAVHGLLEYLAEEYRRPKSTNRLKLRRITEGRGYLTTSKVATRAHRVRATGEIYVPPAQIVIPGGVVASHSRSVSRSRKLPTRAAGATCLGTYRHRSATNLARSAAAAACAVLSSRNTTYPASVNSSGASKVTLLTTKHSTNFDRVAARGKINLSTDTIVAIAHLYARR